MSGRRLLGAFDDGPDHTDASYDTGERNDDTGRDDHTPGDDRAESGRRGDDRVSDLGDQERRGAVDVGDDTSIAGGPDPATDRGTYGTDSLDHPGEVADIGARQAGDSAADDAAPDVSPPHDTDPGEHTASDTPHGSHEPDEADHDGSGRASEDPAEDRAEGTAGSDDTETGRDSPLEPAATSQRERTDTTGTTADGADTAADADPRRADGSDRDGVTLDASPASQDRDTDSVDEHPEATPVARRAAPADGDETSDAAEHVAAHRGRGQPAQQPATRAGEADQPDQPGQGRPATGLLEAEGLTRLTHVLPERVLDRLDTVLATDGHRVERDLPREAAAHDRSCVYLPASESGDVVWVCHPDCTAHEPGGDHRDLGRGWLADHLGQAYLDRARPGAAAIEGVGHLVDDHGPGAVTLGRWGRSTPHGEDCIRVAARHAACGPDCVGKQLDTDQRATVAGLARELRDSGQPVNPRADWLTLARRAGSWDSTDLARALTPTVDRSLHTRDCATIARGLTSCASDCRLGGTDRHPDQVAAATRLGHWRDTAALPVQARITWPGLARLAEQAGTWDAERLVTHCAATVPAGADWARSNMPPDSRLNVDTLAELGARTIDGTELRASPWVSDALHTDSCIRLGRLAACVDCDAPAAGSAHAAVATVAAAWFVAHPEVRALPATAARIDHLTRFVDGDAAQVPHTLETRRSDAWPPSPLDYVRVRITDRLATDFGRSLGAYFRNEVARFRWQTTQPLEALRYDIDRHPLGSIGRHRLRGWLEPPPWHSTRTDTPTGQPDTADQPPADRVVAETGDRHDDTRGPEAAPDHDSHPRGYSDPRVGDGNDTATRDEHPPTTTGRPSDIGAADTGPEREDQPTTETDTSDSATDTVLDAAVTSGPHSDTVLTRPSADDPPSADHSAEKRPDWGDIDRGDHGLAVAANQSRAIWDPGPTVTRHYMATGTPLVDRWVATTQAAAHASTPEAPYPGAEPLPVASPAAFAAMSERDQATVLRYATIEARLELIAQAGLWQHPLGVHANETWDLYGDQLRASSDAGFWWAIKDLDTPERVYAFGGSDPLLRARYEYALRIDAGLIPPPPAPEPGDVMPWLPRYDTPTPLTP